MAKNFFTGFKSFMGIKDSLLKVFKSLGENNKPTYAVMAIAAVTRAFSSQKKKNIVTAGIRLSGYVAKEPFPIFFQVRSCIAPSKRARINAPAGAW